MDSGNNSGSMQSSSGNDEEFQSRGSDSISSFLNNPSSHFTTNTTFFTTQNPNFFDPNPQNPFSQSNPTTQFSDPNNPNTNHDLIWSRPGLRSDPHQQQQHHHQQQPNYHPNIGNLTNPSSSSLFPSSRPTQSAPYHNPSSSVPLRTDTSDAHATRAGTDHHLSIKNPKKRTRASRRAPTTVLTTDTSNFRQMVQEFTGIPAVPFSGSAYSRRLDLFSAASALRPGLETLGPLYPLRPAAQKVNLSPFSSSSPLLNPTMIDSNNSATNSTMGGASGSNSNNSSNFQLHTGTTNDHFLNNLQQQQQQQQSGVVTMNFGNMSGYPSHHHHHQETRTQSESTQVGNNSNSNDGMRWRERNGRNDGVIEVNLQNNFDGNNNNGDSIVQQHHHHQQQAGYNLNVVVTEKAGGEGNVAAASSWICQSD